ncbi:urea ABC transporter ATP-binding protein UrtD [Desulfoscipio geothermicus]|uniref:Urea transport system ATP-binding protein n=1 Tax=Desulfoscipio geothermicus DSM 3669 TaxID=1121426 RepID=A0A1I6EAC5_9FIRM|nr:urea ABC transporter ATP-binding protein UrtD [Desulfoscipio geothermicus]SFR14597.1 urea transport system ATP-binding protein [Desulfoscipio geothermicus DSM 3669]
MDTVLEIKDLTVSFDGFKAVNDVSTAVKKGDIHFFIGPNGAGKTTLLDAICGRVKPAAGSIFFKDCGDVTKLAEHEIVERGIGRKFQVPSVFNSITVFENMELAAEKKRTIFSTLFSKLSQEQMERIEYVLNIIGLYEKRFEKPAALSHGEKQWLEIGMLFVQQPEIMLLDEPVAGMGRKETDKTGELLKEIAKDCSVVVVEHDMDFVRDFASTVTVLHEGTLLVEGDMEEVQKDPRVIEVYLGRGGE